MRDNNNTTTTTKETALLNSIAEGMDAPGEGWLHEIADASHSTAGILGSLIKKGLATSLEEKEPGMPPVFWVEITAAGSSEINA